MKDFNNRARRTFLLGAILAGGLIVLCVVVLLWWNQSATLEDNPGERLFDDLHATAPEAARSGGEAPQAETVTTTTEKVQPADDENDSGEAPPLLTGKIRGDGEGIGGAEVRLYALQRIKRTLGRLERLAPRGSEIPDIHGIVAEVRAELRTLRKTEIVAVSAADGTYTFQDPPPDAYLVLATASEWMFHFGDVVDLELGRTVTQDVELFRGESISGQVVSTGGLPLAGVRVAVEFRPAGVPGIGRIIRRAMRYVNGEFLRGPLESSSATDGTFTITSLPPGMYDVMAKTPTGIEVREHSVESSTSDIVITIGKGAIVQGYILTTAGTPIAGVPIQLERLDDRIQLPIAMIAFADLANTVYNLLGEGPRQDTSSRDGSFRFQALSPGKYQLKVQSRGYLPWFRTFEVAWGEHRQLDPVRLDAGSAVFGVVTSESGAPVPGAKVSVVPHRMGITNMSSTMRDVIGGRNAAIVGEDGTFRVSGLSSGTYLITAGAPGFGGASAESNAPSDQPVELLLASGRLVTGRVTDVSTKKPLKNARVKASGVMAKTDAGGRYVLEGVVAQDPGRNPFGFSNGRRRRSRDGGVRPAIVGVEVKADGYATSSRSLTAGELGGEINFALQSLPKMAGRVLDPDGNPAPGSLVRLTPVIPDAIQEVAFSRLGIDRGIIFLAATVADLDGRFTLSDYSIEGRQAVQVIADHPLYARGVSASIPAADLLDGRDLDVEVQLERTGSIQGVVTDGTGPVARAQIRLRRKRESRVGSESRRIDGFLGMIGIPKSGESIYTNSDGVFHFRRRRPGTYELQAEVPGFKPSGEVVVEVADGETSQVTLEVSPGGEIAGTAVDLEGRPLAGVNIRLLRGGEGERVQIQRFLGGAYKRTRTAPETGEFAFPGLPEGTFIVIGERAGFVTAEVTDVESGDTAVQLQLLPAAELVGRVLDSLSHEPINEFTVDVRADIPGGGQDRRSPFRFPRSEQSPDGTFRRTGLTAGTYRVAVKSPGYLPAVRKVTLTVGSSAAADFALQEAGRVGGAVVDLRSGEAIEGATVALSTPPEPAPGASEKSERVEGEAGRKSVLESENPTSSLGHGDGTMAKEDREALRKFWRTRMANEDASTLSDGTFLLRGVPSGIQRITVSHPAYIPERIDNLDVQIGREATVEVRLRPGATLTGLVKDSAGEPLSNRFIFLRGTGRETEWVRKSATTAPDGRFRIDGLLPGPYRLLAPSRRGAMPALAVDITEGRPEVEFVIPEE